MPGLNVSAALALGAGLAAAAAARPGETVEWEGVRILGPLNIPSTIPYHASQMYAKNVVTFLLHLVTDGELELDMEDEITAGTLITRGGEVVHPQVLEAMGASSEGSNRP